MFSKITLALAVAVAGLASSAVMPQTASANDYGHGYSQKVHQCSYKTILTYEYERVAYKVKVVKYRSCGTPYYKWVTKWKTVKVPVYKRVRTCGCGY